MCRLANFCFDFDNNEYFHLADEPILAEFKHANGRFADMSSVNDHNAYYWRWKTVGHLNNSVIVDDYDTNKAPTFRQVKVINETVHLIKRFFPVNIMHMFHDDVFGMAHLYWRMLPKGTVKQTWFIDDYGRNGPYQSVYDQWLGTRVNYLNDLKERNRIVCYKDAIIGNPKRFVWYQYGLKQPQSVIAGHGIARKELRAVFSLLRSKATNGRLNSAASDMSIAIFTRGKTRILLNEQQLVASLKDRYGLPVVTVGLEGMELPEIVEVMSKSVIAIGMHGSLLVMAGFMPPRSLLLEAFPFAVPPSDYQPYAEMCRILGFTYRSWSSPHSSEPLTLAHPERGRFDGGLWHLPENERREILSQRWVKPHKCCYNAAWLFRIFQDTAIDIGWVFSEIDGFIHNNHHRFGG